MYPSIDGRLDTSRFSKPYGKESPDDIGDCYFTIADDFKPDAYMLGRKTPQVIFDKYLSNINLVKKHSFRLMLCFL